jgi:energy-coupling factor transporter ATP-binding protein EcfA2
LTVLPSEISQLTHLTQLDLSDNQLTMLLKEIKQLTHLALLDLSNNQLEALPPEIVQLRNLIYLYLNGNSLSWIPSEIQEGGDARRILNFYKQLLEQETDYLYEAKLLIVGESGAGKTTLAKKIKDLHYQLQKDEESTEGIDVTQWDFPLDNGRQFRVNIWDFGGQEIYHATHQFFLTKRSLYALVADTRKEDTDFYYWLNVVELLSDGSPLLIVKNEKQDRHREINERQLWGQFKNIKESLGTNLATNRGLDRILDRIQFYIRDLSHIGTRLPKTWVQIRQALEQDPRNHIPVEEYFNICQQNGFTEQEDKLQLSGYLHDLGVCLHFQNDPLLKKTVILKPKWGTYAVYKVLDNEQVIRNLGRFTWSDLADIWRDDEYANMQNELLRLMINFKLCYEILGNSGTTYIAPQLLTANQPQYDWDKANNLTLRYTYEFMPKGILTQFIVVMHQLIDQQQYVWRSGVILSKDQTKAEIIENYGKREIKIRVAGRDKKELMTIVTYEMDRIHNTYPRLKFNKLIPCNCFVCRNQQEPYFYRFESLKRRIADKQYQVECDVSYERVDVLSLIDDVIDRNRKHLFREEKGFSHHPSQRNLGTANISIYMAQTQAQNKNQTLHNAQFAGGLVDAETVTAHQIGGTITNYTPEQKQNLAEAAAEIQQLLQQLEQTYPTNTPLQKQVVVTEALRQIESNPTLKTRVIGALKAGGTEALKERLDHRLVNILLATLEGWQEVE